MKKETESEKTYKVLYNNLGKEFDKAYFKGWNEAIKKALEVWDNCCGYEFADKLKKLRK